MLHQNTIYEATVAVVPHLIELFADDTAPDQTLGYDLVNAILTEAEGITGVGTAVRDGIPVFLKLLEGWPVNDGNLIGAAAEALSSLTVRSAPTVAAALMPWMRTGGDDATPFFVALPILLDAVFPSGPLPPGSTAADLTPEQYAAAHMILHSGVAGHVSVSRQLRERGLPGDEDTLTAWLGRR